jgi:DMSO/TMAO reductase YedYZ molybdopterin-dependent catalytic subunit
MHALLSAGAFLATKMNGELLTADHGAPVRLVVPSWYGCVCIKWVNEISFVDENAPATSQMREFASRTHQSGIPDTAADYHSATIDPAAMPVRVEKWIVSGRIVYRVVGITWGGTKPSEALSIQFSPEGQYRKVTDVQPRKGDSWGFWTYNWAPRRPGTYVIRMKVTDENVRTRRLDSGYYARAVSITEI